MADIHLEGSTACVYAGLIFFKVGLPTIVGTILLNRGP